MRAVLALLAAAVLSVASAMAEDAPRPAGAPAPELLVAEAEALLAGDIEDDWLRAAGLLRQAADAGVAAARYQLGLLYDEGKGVPPDPAEAARLYRAAAETGSLAAMYRLGILFEEGRGVDRDLETARGYLARAARGGVVEAMTRLGAFYAAQGNAAESL